MKKLLLKKLLLSLSVTFIFMVLGSGFSYGQQNRDRIEALKIAFITKRMNLTPAEAQTFWPLYNEYNDKVEALKKERRKKFKSDLPNLDSLSQKEIESLIDDEITFRQKEVDLQKEYHVKLKQVLPARKIAELYLAEEAFKRELLRRLKEQNGR